MNGAALDAERRVVERDSGAEPLGDLREIERPLVAAVSIAVIVSVPALDMAYSSTLVRLAGQRRVETNLGGLGE
jgi:hypothetical protein